MVKLKTKTEKELFDKRLKSLGFHIVRLIVNEISANGSGAVANGFYYYEDENGQQVLDAFRTNFAWETVAMAETELPEFNSNSLKDAFIQRIIEFSFMQQQIESGENYGTIYTDWELDNEEN